MQLFSHFHFPCSDFDLSGKHDGDARKGKEIASGNANTTFIFNLLIIEVMWRSICS